VPAETADDPAHRIDVQRALHPRTAIGTVAHMRRRAINRWLAILGLALQVVVFLPAQVLASIGAERCCADHCRETRSAQSDLDCCRVEAGGQTDVTTGRQVAHLPALATWVAPMPAVSPAALLYGNSTIDSVTVDESPPTYLRLLSLRL
jgi:hypothetical protein